MHNDISFELRFDGCEGLPNPLYLSRPTAVFEAWGVSDVLPAITQAEAAWSEGYIVAGFVSYEAAPAFEPALPPGPAQSLPLVFFAAFEQGTELPPALEEGLPNGQWRPDTDRAAYGQAISSIRKRIAAGEVYQVNYTYRMKAEFLGNPLAWYRRISRSRHGAYSAFLRLGRYSVLSFSPELFFSLNGNQITAKPMKGTAPRGYWPAKDRENYQRLASSEKDRAENLMILDLMRNDLGKVARVGSVSAQSLFEIQALPTVYQMTSTVTAALEERVGITRLFQSLFPSGSITGAPKISAMKLIQKLEKSPRGVYCGAIGVMYPGRRAVFNVAIRTLTIDQENKTAELGVGGGITWDSTAAAEYDETIAKSRFVTDPWPEFKLLETMRLEDGVYYLLDRHLHRLARSAEYFGIPLEMNAVRRLLMDRAGTHLEGIWRVRLTANREGEIAIECSAFALAGKEPQRVAISPIPMRTNSPFIYHKTTSRQSYEQRREHFPEAFDVLLMNEHGRYTEFTIGNLVVERNGTRFTPPVSEGLLPGVMREELLESGEIVERAVTDADLRSAEAIWLINSVRGWVRVTLAHTGEPFLQ